MERAIKEKMIEGYSEGWMDWRSKKRIDKHAKGRIIQRAAKLKIFNTNEKTKSKQSKELPQNRMSYTAYSHPKDRSQLVSGVVVY